jgi:DNA gyrase subunit A
MSKNLDTNSVKKAFAKEVFEVSVEEEISDSFLAYSLSVITSRAIPDARDGLKPVQRRILYSLEEQSIRPSGPYKKCARIVGDCMGKYHPHGDSAIYEALVRLAQPFSLSVPLVDGHGNFGSPDDPPAASRYTECKMSPAAMEMIGELSEESVDMRDNYDSTETEPTVLPARIPNLLVNGTTGIAVGMATNIPTHNISNIVSGALAVLQNKNITLADIMTKIPGPDFPTGGIIVDDGGIAEAYATGRGSFKIRGKCEVGQVTVKRKGITITELPYGVGPERLITKCRQLIQTRHIDGIADVRDLSDRKRGLCIVVECKAGINPQVVLNDLYQKTPLEESFSTNAVALVAGKPETLSLRRMLDIYLEHRLEVVVRRSEYRLRRAQDRAHIVEGLVLALGLVDDVVALIKKSNSAETAKVKLVKTFKLTEIQASHILEMPLRLLTGLEVTKLKKELQDLKAVIKTLVILLKSDAARRAVVAEELKLIEENFGSPRRTTIIKAEDAQTPTAALDIEDSECEVGLTLGGLLFRRPVLLNSTSATTLKKISKKPTPLLNTVSTTVRKKLKIITKNGKLFYLDTVDIPEAEGKLLGARVAELINLEPGDIALYIIPEEYTGDLMLFTKKGLIKKLTSEGIGTKPGSIIKLSPDDSVVGVCVVNDQDNVIIVTANAQLLKTPVAKIRAQGRTAGGVSGIKLGLDTEVILGTTDSEISALYTLTDSGRVKCTSTKEYPIKGRGGIGVRCMRMKKDESKVASAVITTGDCAGLGPRLNIVTLLEEPEGRRDGTGVLVNDSITTLSWVE